MAGSASHPLMPRPHLPRLSLVVAWALAVLLAIAGFAVWVLPAF
jgi:hypothetical protein